MYGWGGGQVTTKGGWWGVEGVRISSVPVLLHPEKVLSPVACHFVFGRGSTFICAVLAAVEGRRSFRPLFRHCCLSSPHACLRPRDHRGGVTTKILCAKVSVLGWFVARSGNLSYLYLVVQNPVLPSSTLTCLLRRCWREAQLSRG